MRGSRVRVKVRHGCYRVDFRPNEASPVRFMTSHARLLKSGCSRSRLGVGLGIRALKVKFDFCGGSRSRLGEPSGNVPSQNHNNMLFQLSCWECMLSTLLENMLFSNRATCCCGSGYMLEM